MRYLTPALLAVIAALLAFQVSETVRPKWWHADRGLTDEELQAKLDRANAGLQPRPTLMPPCQRWQTPATNNCYLP